MPSHDSGRVASVVVAALMTGLAACAGAAETGVPTLRWYVADSSDYAALARSCSDASEGAYRIELVEAPDGVAERRADLLRRSRADDDLDLIAVDTALTGDLAAAGLLADVPKKLREDFENGRTEAALAASTVDGRLATVPWWYEPQVLFSRGSAAERAGLDLSGGVGWDALVTGAARIGGTVQIDATMAQWVSALIVGAGSERAPGDPGDPAGPLSGAAAGVAAALVAAYAAAAVGPGPSEDAVSSFAAPGGSFLVAPISALSSAELRPVRAEVEVTAYPRASGEVEVARTPLTGASLAVADASDRREKAFAAIACLTGAEAQEMLALSTGHLPTLQDTLKSEAVGEAVGETELVSAAMAQGAPEPNSTEAFLVGQAVESTWLPLARVGGATPAISAAEARRLLDGGLL
ncbi:MAG: ABC transporter substrate-binding protein [Aeromicrobium sp.]|uniref:extracellular solute-binding protein n=1 Tax=Aeromicrobium sp. TaxID=1871063 RepID=UPI0039E5B389